MNQMCNTMIAYTITHRKLVIDKKIMNLVQICLVFLFLTPYYCPLYHTHTHARTQAITPTYNM